MLNYSLKKCLKSIREGNFKKVDVYKMYTPVWISEINSLKWNSKVNRLNLWFVFFKVDQQEKILEGLLQILRWTILTK